MLFEHFLKITLFEIINFSTHQTTDMPSALSLYHKSLLIDTLFFHYPLFPQIPRLGNLTFHDFDRNNFSRGLRITTRRTTIHEELQSRATNVFTRDKFHYVNTYSNAIYDTSVCRTISFSPSSHY